MGVTTLPGLVTKEALKEAIQEVEEKMERSYTMQTNHNIYLSKEDWDNMREKDHAANRRLDTKVAALACDQIKENSPLKILFKSDAFLSFVQHVLGVPILYRNVDPIGAVFVNIYQALFIIFEQMFELFSLKDGYLHNWHFDESHWSTTLMLQQPEQGGHFQYTKPFRNEENEEETYEVAEKVLTGDMDHINTLEFQPGKS